MEFNFWILIFIPIIVAVVVNIVNKGNETLFSYLKSRFKRYFQNTDVTEASNGIITGFECPYELRIGSFTNISLTFKGTVKRAFFSCQIIDCLDRYNWCPALATLRDLDMSRQTGVLNLKNEKRSVTWPINPETFLTKGQGRFIIGVFEERDIVKDGNIIENHTPIALKEKEVLLT